MFCLDSPGPRCAVGVALHRRRRLLEIPLDAIRSLDTSNLFSAGRTIDGDRSACASPRVMGTAFATGHAAGVAAAPVAAGGTAGAGDVRKELLRQDAYLP